MKRKICGAVLCLSAVLTVGIVLLNYKFVKIKVPSGSMEPTIMAGSRLLVSRTSSIGRGDVVMFYSDEEDCYVIKRLIGEPGDVVDIRSGTVYVNGSLLNEPYLGSFDDTSGVYCVPDDSYFFLGDNRRDSLDSRFWENPYIYKGRVVGKALGFIDKGFRRLGERYDSE